MKEFRTLSELSALSGIKYNTLKKMALEERMIAKKSGRVWLTSIEELCDAVRASNKSITLLAGMNMEFKNKYYV